MSISQPLKLNNYPQKALSNEHSQFMIHVLMAEDSSLAEIVENEPMFNGSSGISRVLHSRLKMIDLKLSNQVIVFMLAANISFSNPGILCLYLHTFKQYLLERGIDKPFNMDHLTNLFPMGYPSYEDCLKAWDDQKNPDGSNQVDQY